MTSIVVTGNPFAEASQKDKIGTDDVVSHHLDTNIGLTARPDTKKRRVQKMTQIKLLLLQSVLILHLLHLFQSLEETIRNVTESTSYPLCLVCFIAKKSVTKHKHI
ncbi:Uncharacterized protein Rs2_36362 [Raphanus sativus]|nr:Uncharacterized protein Rs2_36362 [Raphanus sativus]